MQSTMNQPDDQRLYDRALPGVLVQLLKGVVYEDRHAKVWPALLQLRAAVQDYFRMIGLELYVDEAEGYAYLKQIEIEEGIDEAEAGPVPKLITRRSLSFPVSLLLVLLRKRLAEEDAVGEASRVILSREQIVDMMLLFMPEQKNEARLNDQINSAINRAIDYGFVRKLKQGDGELLEIRRILKAFVDAQWLDEFQVHLKKYQGYADENGD